jgi:formylglycine-generating enzyme required for sulfatase activity
MQWIPGGTFLMGSNDFYPEERPVREVTVDGFWMDSTPVTNAQFADFVSATDYHTVAERQPDARCYPGTDPRALVPGSLLFTKPGARVDLRDHRAWWRYEVGASWKEPDGPGSTIAGREDHPVVHVAYDDALAYASWCGKALPSEAEWEYAARGGLHGAAYVWGDEFMPQGRILANTWHGEFPWQNLATHGYEGTSPVDAFPPNGYGLYDMAGNVWEWTSDVFTTRRVPNDATPCCAKAVTATSARHGAFDAPPVQIPQHVVKGGSHLCAPNYCRRYRPAARQGQMIDTSACHIGFRCIARMR